MKRSTPRWTTAVAAAALIGLPAAGFAQTPASPQTQPQNPPTQSPASPTSQNSAGGPAEHVREAKQTVSSIDPSTLPANARPKIAQLRAHLNNLEKQVAKAETGADASKSAKGASNWGTEIAAVDKIVTDLIGSDTGSAASAGSMASGTAGSPTGTSGKAPATIDDATKDKLREVRKQITELAGSMSGTPKTESSAAGASSADTMGAAPSAASSASPSAAAPSAATPTAPTPEPTTASPSPTQTEPSASPSPSVPTAQPQQPEAAQPPESAAAQPPASAQEQQPSAPAGQANKDAAKQHLTEARESLSQIAGMPEASKLQGETRNQVSQLIANFNDLITTQSDWKASYAKVDATLTALLGADDANAPQANPSSPAGTTGTAGAPSAAGTTGTSGLDPAIRAKLLEFRTHMKEFEQAAGGAPAAQSAGAMSPSVSTGSTTSPANPAPSSQSTAYPQSATPTNPTANPTPTGATSAGATGTTGSTPASPTAETSAPPTTAGTPGATGTTGSASAAPAASANPEIEKHFQAIDEILSKAKNGKLDKDQTDQIKMHVDQLRQLINK